MEDIVMHIDVNSAFLSWTAASEKQQGIERDLRNMVAVIGGNEKDRHGIVLAKSVLAKKFNIKTGDSLFEARQKYHNLIIVPPNYSVCIKASSSLMKYLSEYTPDIQIFSIDECFLKFTNMDREQAIQLANTIKNNVYKEFGYTVNVGVSVNKLRQKWLEILKNLTCVILVFLRKLKINYGFFRLKIFL